MKNPTIRAYRQAVEERLAECGEKYLKRDLDLLARDYYQYYIDERGDAPLPNQLTWQAVQEAWKCNIQLEGRRP